MDPNGSILVLGSAVGSVLPLVIDALNRRHWSKTARGFSALGICLVAASVETWQQGKWLDGSDYVQAAFATCAAAFVLYNQFYAPSGISAAVREATG